MAGQKTSVRSIDQAESLFEVWDKFFGQRLSPRAVVDLICEFVMAGRERAVEEDVNHFGAFALTHLSVELTSLSPCAGVISAETVYVVDAGISLLRIFAVTRRQNDSGSHRDRAPPEFTEHRTLKFDELDVLGISGFKARRSRARQRQFNRFRFRGVQVFDFDDRAGQIAFILAVIRVSVIRISAVVKVENLNPAESKPV